MLIDDFRSTELESSLGTRWRGVSDRVMGGVSEALLGHEVVAGRPSMRLRGEVRLENDGGFIQAALDLSPAAGTLDASGYAGLRLTVCGNGERYGVHLRTTDCIRPWQSYRASFVAGSRWAAIELAFHAFRPHRVEVPLDLTRLRRIGLAAIGRAFVADLAVCEIRLYP